MELTDVEKKIVEAYRQGADVKMYYFYAYTYQEVMQLLEGYQIRRIADLDKTVVFAGYDTSEREICKKSLFKQIKKDTSDKVSIIIIPRKEVK